MKRFIALIAFVLVGMSVTTLALISVDCGDTGSKTFPSQTWASGGVSNGPGATAGKAERDAIGNLPAGHFECADCDDGCNLSPSATVEDLNNDPVDLATDNGLGGRVQSTEHGPENFTAAVTLLGGDKITVSCTECDD